MRFVGHGHAAVRATHAKTLEFTAGSELTERGTCIAAVGAQLPQEPMAGPVTITVSAGGHVARIEAEASSMWRPGGSLVIRRSAARTPETFAVEADAGAADLPRELVAALREPDATVEVEVIRRPSPPTLVVADAHTSQRVLRAERAAADLIVDTNPNAGLPTTGRTLVITAQPLADRRPPPDGVRVRTVGVPPQLAAAIAAPWSGPVLFGESVDLLRRAPAEALLVLGPVATPDDLLRRAGDLRGSTQAVLARGNVDPEVVSTEHPPRLGGDGPYWCCVGPARLDGLDPGVSAALDALLADGVPTRSAARALAALTGWERRRAYDVVLGRAR